MRTAATSSSGFTSHRKVATTGEVDRLAPKLVISDGHKGLTKALEKWPECRLQRCTEHKRANLLEHCPAHARRELRRDYKQAYSKIGISRL